MDSTSGKFTKTTTVARKASRNQPYSKRNPKKIDNDPAVGNLDAEEIPYSDEETPNNPLSIVELDTDDREETESDNPTVPLIHNVNALSSLNLSMKNPCNYEFVKLKFIAKDPTTGLDTMVCWCKHGKGKLPASLNKRREYVCGKLVDINSPEHCGFKFDGASFTFCKSHPYLKQLYFNWPICNSCKCSTFRIYTNPTFVNAFGMASFTCQCAGTWQNRINIPYTDDNVKESFNVDWILNFLDEKGKKTNSTTTTAKGVKGATVSNGNSNEFVASYMPDSDD